MKNLINSFNIILLLILINIAYNLSIKKGNDIGNSLANRIRRSPSEIETRVSDNIPDLQGREECLKTCKEKFGVGYLCNEKAQLLNAYVTKNSSCLYYKFSVTKNDDTATYYCTTLYCVTVATHEKSCTTYNGNFK
uniref:Apple domain-containing protein n=1 Tax=Strongyloides papillosus TaxID=174720 RepID=A0A0N5BRK4_STREA